MGLFDLLSGWTLWAPFTFVIVALMGFTVGKLTEDEKHQNFKWYVIAIAAACVIKVVGYYIAEVVIYGNPFSPVTSIPGNLVQIGVAAVITLIVIAPLNVAAKRTGLKIIKEKGLDLMYKIMTPGPTQVAENVRLARSRECTNPDLDESFVEFYKETCEEISRLLHTDNETLILGGEGILGLRLPVLP